MKQTAVEWLVKNVEDFFGGLIAPSIIEQAKAMEKEQIIQARTTAPIIPTIDMIDYVKESEAFVTLWIQECINHNLLKGKIQ